MAVSIYTLPSALASLPRREQVKTHPELTSNHPWVSVVSSFTSVYDTINPLVGGVLVVDSAIELEAPHLEVYS